MVVGTRLLASAPTGSSFAAKATGAVPHVSGSRARKAHNTPWDRQRLSRADPKREEGQPEVRMERSDLNLFAVITTPPAGLRPTFTATTSMRGVWSVDYNDPLMPTARK